MTTMKNTTRENAAIGYFFVENAATGERYGKTPHSEASAVLQVRGCSMTDKRREQIMASLRAGNKIHRQWVGGNSGYLNHFLQGVTRLRESEFKDLQDAKIVRRISVGGQFKPLELVWTGPEII
jgi:hypothetical protein